MDARPVLILTAVREEAGPLLRLLSERRRLSIPNNQPAWSGMIEGRPAILAVAGMGGKARETASFLLDWPPSPLGLVLAGVAGALDGNLERGALIVPAEVRHGDETYRPRPLEVLHLPNAHTGSLLTLDRILTTREEKRIAAGESGALAVDMEAGHIAAAAQSHNTPWLCVRAISDTADEDLPLDFNRCLNAAGQLSMPRLLIEIARRPGSIPGLLHLGRNTRAAMEGLATFLEGLLPVWLAACVAACPEPPSEPRIQTGDDPPDPG